MSEAFLDVRDLRVLFPTEDGVVSAVDGVDFSVEKGKTLAIVGESGSGKSVTSQAIMGLINRKTAKMTGEVYLDGEELVGARPELVRSLRGKRMAMIFQDPLSSLHPFYAIGKHGLRAGLTPIVTAAGIDLATLLGGAIITERIFNLNGIGALAIGSVVDSDLPVITGTVLLAATFVIVANLIVDILYAVIDPRVRLT